MALEGGDSCREKRSFSAMLKCFRGLRGMTQEDLAEASGLSVNGVQYYESGKRQPTNHSFDHLVDALKLDDIDRAALNGLRAAATPSTLPSPPTSFVGRRALVEQIAREIARAGRGLFTLTGPGGVGKTRLALAVGAELERRFRHGARFVDLSAVSESSLVPRAIAQALGCPIDDQRPVIDVLIEFLADKEILLILDNFEHVLDAAPEISRRLLTECPRVEILATSRARLDVYGERVCPIEPLELPLTARGLELDALAENDAVALFVDRARGATWNFALTAENAADVVEICRRLEGLPLAIELAAARLAQFRSIEILLRQLLHRLAVLDAGWRDRADRQRTMHGAIAWSYGLLDEGDKLAFRRLSVVTGGCTPEAAAHLCATAPADLTADDVAALVDLVIEPLATKNLLRRTTGPGGQPRFAMYETIREFGLATLAPSEEADARLRLAEWLVAFAEERTAASRGPKPKAVLDELEAEMPNFRSTFGWLTGDGAAHVDLALRLGHALWYFWKQRSYMIEGRSWLDQAIELGRDLDSEPFAWALIDRANSDEISSDRAMALFEESARVFKALANQPGYARALVGCGMVAGDLGDQERAADVLHEALAVYEQIDDRRGSALVAHHIGLLRMNHQDHGEADHWLRIALNGFQAVQDGSNERFTLLWLGRNARYAGHLDVAERLLGQCLGLFEAIGDNEGAGTCLVDMGLVDAQREQWDPARAHLHQGLSMLQPLSMSEIQRVIAIEGLANVAVATGQAFAGMRLLGAIEVWQGQSGMTRHHVDLAANVTMRRTAQSVLGNDRSDAAVQEGRQLSLSEAVALALDFPDQRAMEAS